MDGWHKTFTISFNPFLWNNRFGCNMIMNIIYFYFIFFVLSQIVSSLSNCSLINLDYFTLDYTYSPLCFSIPPFLWKYTIYVNHFLAFVHFNKKMDVTFTLEYISAGVRTTICRKLPNNLNFFFSFYPTVSVTCLDTHFILLNN